MSEPIKNTLFRFATMRTPELIPEKDRKDYHIHHPNPLTTGFFHTQFASPASTFALQMQALATMAAGFTAMTTKAAVKTYVGDDFFDYSVWIAKNHTAIFAGTAAAYTGTVPAVLTSTQVTAIWDNLFYQVITDNNPQLRELFIELLVANGYRTASGQSWQNQLAVARVVIPLEFYGPHAINPLANLASGNELPSGSSFNTSQLKAANDAAISSGKIGAYQQLLEELRVAKKSYDKTTSDAYNAAKKTYQDDIYDTLDSFGVFPDDGSGGGGGGLSGARPGPDISRFDFTPGPEMEHSFLSSKLSAASYALAGEMGLPDQTDFVGAIAAIDQAIADESAKASHFISPGNQSVIMNNMVFPVGQQIIHPGGQYSYFMEALLANASTNSWRIYCTIDMGVPDENIVGASYNAVLTSGTQSSTTLNVMYHQGNFLTIVFYPSGSGLTLPTAQTSFRFFGTLQTAGSLTLTFDFTYAIHSDMYGFMELTTPGEGGGGGQTVTPPSGYGIKRLGLADYRRVEQSVCCYLPGEVSHIENVMAREYKERATRRLTRSEDTTTLETSMEKETQKDTSSTERYELQKEIDSVISKDMSMNADASVSGKVGAMNISAGASFAYNTSRQDSNKVAVNYSKEVTEKALERVVTKIREERIIKIIEEYEEQNKHGYDHRLGDQHVSGVYRWVDKVYKNQVYNYGKRLMYEFMIPQPAVFHNEAMKVLASQPTTTVLIKPVDPRTLAGTYQMANPTKVNTVTFPYWSGIYKADLKAAPDEFITISQSFSMGGAEATGDYKVGAKDFKMDLPDGYEATQLFLGAVFIYNGGNTTPNLNIRVANDTDIYIGGSTGVIDRTVYLTQNPIRKTIGLSAQARNLGGLAINITANCRRTAENYANWQIESFNAIIDQFNEQMDAYNKAMAAYQQPVATTSKDTNPGFYRQIENMVLRKNCITYLVSDGMMGKKYYQGNSTIDIMPVVNAPMDKYASMVKFIEQAFEWDIMSYKFYPFYWGDRQGWQQTYQVDLDDPIFRAFLQSGMARAIVSIRPGFEEAVMYFMATGKIWNGGQVPAIGDDLYLSIVEEIKNPEYYIDETWETRVPTSLNVIQSGAIGLEQTGLPCACGDENDVEQNSNKLGVVLPPKDDGKDDGPATVLPVS